LVTDVEIKNRSQPPHLTLEVASQVVGVNEHDVLCISSVPGVTQMPHHARK
jgi:hypothetical protein